MLDIFGHGAHRRGQNTATAASKIAGEPDLIYINNIVEPRINITSIFNEIKIYYLQERGGAGPGGLTSLLVAMSFGGHFGQPVLIAAHRPIGQFVPYRRMQGDWHGLAKKAAKTDSS